MAKILNMTLLSIVVAVGNEALSYIAGENANGYNLSGRKLAIPNKTTFVYL